MKTTDLNVILEKIKETLPLSRIVERDVRLQKKGLKHIGLCPFHNEKTPSFMVDDKKGLFHCFGCKASGDVVSFLMKIRGINFIQAVEELAGIAGIRLPDTLDNKTKAPPKEQQVLQKTMEFFKKTLKNTPKALEYCKKRGIFDDVLDSFSIGFSKPGDELLIYLKSLGFSDNILEKTGVFTKKNGKLIQKFNNRIMFPVFDKRGWPIAFGGRSIQKEDIPKYLNSPETDLFLKKETLYGYNIASKNVSSTNQFIVVEGYVDAVIMHQNGFKTTIASMGTAVSETHLQKMWRYSKEPIFCFDGDGAGYSAMVRAAMLAIPNISPQKTLRFCMLPQNEDPDSFLATNGAEAMKSLLNSSVYLIDFLWEYWQNELLQIPIQTPEYTAKWKQEILSLLDGITDKDVRQIYLNTIKTRIYEFLRKPTSRDIKTTMFSRQIAFINKKDKIVLREALLLYIIIMRPSVLSGVLERLASVDFVDPELEKVRRIIAESCDIFDFAEYLQNHDKKEALDAICEMANGKYNLEHKDEKDVLDFWNDLFDINFSKNIQKKELDIAKDECFEDLTKEKWERLKALKIESLGKSFKKDG